MNSFHPQRGAAFLYVMLIFMAASIIIGGMLATGYQEVDRTERYLSETQAVQYALGAELYARQRLDGTGPGKGLWSGSQSPFTIDGGTVAMEVEDLHGRFNINSLLASNELAEPHFIALCTGFGIPEKTVMQALAQIHMLKPPPPVPGVAPVTPKWFADSSELADHILPVADYLKIAPYITALPTDSFTINLNTAPDPVLLAYLDKAELLDAVHAILKTQGAITSDQMSKFQNHDNSLALDSSAYALHVVVAMNGQPPVRMSSILMHLPDQKRMAAIARSWE